MSESIVDDPNVKDVLFSYKLGDPLFYVGSKLGPPVRRAIFRFSKIYRRQSEGGILNTHLSSTGLCKYGLKSAQRPALLIESETKQNKKQATSNSP